MEYIFVQRSRVTICGLPSLQLPLGSQLELWSAVVSGFCVLMRGSIRQERVVRTVSTQPCVDKSQWLENPGCV